MVWSTFQKNKQFFIQLIRDSAQKLIKVDMKKTLNQYDTSVPVRAVWTRVQISFKCCGVDSYTDWKAVPSLKKTNSVPNSCCKAAKISCGKGALIKPNGQAEKFLNTNGCFPVIKDYVFEMANMLKWGMLALGLVQTCVIVIGLGLAKKYKLDHQAEYVSLIPSYLS